MSGNQAFQEAEAQGAESVWAELEHHLERSKGLCLVFLCSDSPAALDWLRVRVNDAWVWRTAPAALLKPAFASKATAEVLGSLQAEVSERPAVRSPVWVDLASVDSAMAPEWNTSRGDVMSRLNEWRSWLQSYFRRPLIFALPLAWRRRMPEVAPDLWHVRTFSASVADLDTSGRSFSSQSFSSDVSGLSNTQSLRTRDTTAEQLLERGAVNGALSQAEKKVVESRQAIALGGGLGSKRALAIALFTLGDTQRYAGRNIEALLSYEEALTILRSLREVVGDSEPVLHDLAVGLSKAGDAQRHVDRLADATASYLESSQIWRALYQQTSASASTARDLAVILAKYGNALNEAGQVGTALEALAESVQLSRAVRRQSGDAADALDDLAMSLDFLSTAQRRAGNLAAALTSCDESVALRRGLAATSNSRESLRDLAVSLGRAGELYRQARNGAMAVASHRESVNLFRELRGRLGEDPVVLQNLGVGLTGLGESLQLAQQHEAALAAFDESVKLFRSLKTDSQSTINAARDLASALMFLADATVDVGKPTEAIDLYRESLSVVNQAAVEHGESPWMALRKADCTQKLGELQTRLGSAVEATQTLEQAVATRRVFAARDDSVDAQRDLFVSLGLLGDAYLRSGMPDEALQTYEASIAGFRVLADRLGNNVDALMDLRRTLEVAGEAYWVRRDAENAGAKFRESLELARQIRQLLGDAPPALDDLANSLVRLADVSGSAELAREAVSVRERLAQAFPGVARYQEALQEAREILARLAATPRG